jgi:hypothetical protein
MFVSQQSHKTQTIVNTVRQEMPVEQIQPQNNSTSDKAKEYEGDDPIVRARLGLPPK